MKLIDKLMSIIADEQKVADVDKRAGVYVSRPVLNGPEWAAWASKWKVPSPLAAADLHVTVIYSTVDVKMVPEDCPMVIPVDRAVFCLLGPDEDAFAVAFQDWSLQNRHWLYMENGAVSTYPTFRPHMTLSASAKGFEIPDAALAEAPEYIVLGGEVAGPVKGQITDDDTDPEGVEEDDDDGTTVIVIEIAAAAKALERTDLNPIDRTAYYDIAKGRPVTAGVLKRLGGFEADVAKAKAKPYGNVKYADPDNSKYPIDTAEHIRAAWSYINMPKNQKGYSDAQVSAIKSKIIAAWKDKIDKAGPPGAQEAKKRVEHDMTLRMTPAALEVAKKKGVADVLKTDDERQLIYAISNVYSIGGQTVEDLDGEGFTTAAMEDFTAQVLKRDASSTWEHEGAPVNTVVQGLVLSDEVQKALGIDLGFECLVTATHFPDQAQWAKAKEGPWEQSIAGRFWYYEDE